MRFLTAKPIIYAANVDEASLAEENAYVQEVDAVAAEQGAEVIRICTRLEEELVDLSPAEQQEYLLLAGVEEGGLQQLIRKSYHLLNLISFFTMNENEVRAWTIQEGLESSTSSRCDPYRFRAWLYSC